MLYRFPVDRKARYCLSLNPGDAAWRVVDGHKQRDACATPGTQTDGGTKAVIEVFNSTAGAGTMKVKIGVRGCACGRKWETVTSGEHYLNLGVILLPMKSIGSGTQ